MSYVGFGLRNSVGLGLGGIPSLLNAPKGAPTPTIDNALLQEDGFFLLQENGDYILLDQMPSVSDYLLCENGDFLVQENGDYIILDVA